ncbi:hypothetical protein TOT_020000779 [Theileria orientalis strain Shintoku]|uniref:Uncharacterized protein n=1 Tax=Theileria orientalis strain Shintoku TaxID=869250 RepID=J4DPD7_THEOR|nr:hypothetical protein TOT_020000779 [Theileria orientalis strain Shintoku]BAM40524.1 hypothetical protein TOT_020000779 [Theileria orientalis strain Shintoku]|eukprot:XP_009690825.1 hypothetical protein TOT_020000779 [Theileria orientalis strain Shintoku]
MSYVIHIQKYLERLELLKLLATNRLTAECSALLRITTGRFLSRPERQPGYSVQNICADHSE